MVVAYNVIKLIDTPKLIVERIDMTNAQKPVVFVYLGEYVTLLFYPVVNIFGLL